MVERLHAIFENRTVGNPLQFNPVSFGNAPLTPPTWSNQRANTYTACMHETAVCREGII